jgi:hypothetical protein
LQQLNTAPDQASREICADEFTCSGSGQAGITYRSILDLEDEDLLDVWSLLLSICDNLWSEGYTEASIKLINASHESFHIPQTLQSRVASSLEAANDFDIMSTSLKAYAEGDDEKAINLTSNIRKQSNVTYKNMMKAEIKSRRRSRKAALGLAAFSLGSLVIVFGIGVVSTIELLRDPPRPELPDFTASKRVFDDMFPERSSDRRALDPEIVFEVGAADVISKPQIDEVDLFASNVSLSNALPPLHAADVAETHFKLEPREVVPEDISEQMTGLVVDTPKLSEDSKTIIEKIEPAITPEVSVELRSNCVTAYAALNHATRMLSEHEDPDAATQRLGAFMATINDACGALKIDALELTVLTGKVDPTESERIAKSVLQ